MACICAEVSYEKVLHKNIYTLWLSNDLHWWDRIEQKHGFLYQGRSTIFLAASLIAAISPSTLDEYFPTAKEPKAMSEKKTGSIFREGAVLTKYMHNEQM